MNTRDPSSQRPGSLHRVIGDDRYTWVAGSEIIFVIVIELIMMVINACMDCGYRE
jgi:hypothetical protein